MPKYKIGDIVKFVKNVGLSSGIPTGSTGVIRSVDGVGSRNYLVSFPSPISDWWVNEEDLTIGSNKYLVEWRSTTGDYKEFTPTWEDAANKVEKLTEDGRVVRESIFLHTITRTQKPVSRKVDLVDV